MQGTIVKAGADKQQASGNGSTERFAGSLKRISQGLDSGEVRRGRSSWGAVDSSGYGGDYLYELGRSDVNLNIDTAQNVQHLDSLFVGNILGHKSDIADGSLRDYEFRKFNNIVGDYYVAPSFLDKIAMHITKNYLYDSGAIDAKARVPLILGIWGEKGMGKTFQTELSFKKLGLEPIVMSAGELEHEWAGTPGRLIRERYRRAAELSKVRGKLSCLMINDIDAGIGRFENTQVTVNNQIVVGTLMNICDNPNRVSIGEGWRDEDRIRRIPIIVTGNDLSTLFAPLVRDGRMDKFYWSPNMEDLVGIVHQMYRDDGVSRADIAALLRRFPKQPLDFFGALRASTYDGQIRRWITDDVVGADISSDDANMSELSKRLLQRRDLPQLEAVTLTLEGLIREGERLEKEQEHVNRNRLSQEYYRGGMKGGGQSVVGLLG